MEKSPNRALVGATLANLSVFGGRCLHWSFRIGLPEVHSNALSSIFVTFFFISQPTEIEEDETGRFEGGPFEDGWSCARTGTSSQTLKFPCKN